MKNIATEIFNLHKRAIEELMKAMEERDEDYLEKKEAVEIVKEKLNLNEIVGTDTKEEILTDLGISEEELYEMLVEQAINENDNLFELVDFERDTDEEKDFENGFPTRIITGVYKFILYENGKYEMIPQDWDYIFDKLDFEYEIFDEGEDKMEEYTAEGDKIVSVHKITTYQDGGVETRLAQEEGIKAVSMDHIFGSLYEEDNKLSIEYYEPEAMGYNPSQHIRNILYIFDELIEIMLQEDYSDISEDIESGGIIDIAKDNLSYGRGLDFDELSQAVNWHIPGKDNILREFIYDFTDKIRANMKDFFHIKYFLKSTVAKSCEDEDCVEDFFEYQINKIHLNKIKNEKSLFN